MLTAAALFPTVVITFGESVLLAFERAVDFVVIELVGSRRASDDRGRDGRRRLRHRRRSRRCSSLPHRDGDGHRAQPSASHRIRARARVATAPSSASSREQVPIVGAIPIVNALYWRADTLLLTWLRGLADVGFYGAATRILDVTRSLPQAYARALYPQLSRAAPGGRGTVSLALSRQSLTWVVAGTIPLSLVISGLAGTIITVSTVPTSTPAAQALAVMAWVMIPYTLTNTLAQILFATGNQAFDLKVNVIATLTSVLLNWR